MTGNIHAAPECASECVEHPEADGKRIPLLEIRVFGGFDVLIDGKPVESSCVRQRKVQTLLGILALNNGQELYSDYLARSIWPRSAPDKQKHCFYNLWYLVTHAVFDGPREENPYFARHQGTCRLMAEHVHTDVQDVQRACDDLMDASLDPVRAIEAYRRLQASYRGDLLPGETENAIVLRARMDWRERVSDALSAAAMSMVDQGEDRTALWLATVACRLSGLREDVARLRMRLFAKMGMQAYAVRAYNELQDTLRDELGMAPSPQSVQVIQQVVDSGGMEYALTSSGGSSRRRRNPRTLAPNRQNQAQLSVDVLPLTYARLGEPM